MNYTIMKKLDLPEEIRKRFHLSILDQLQIMRHRREIKNILSGHDERIILIIGPCSAWPQEAVLTYAEKLSRLNDKVNKSIKIVMRAYTQKPRTKIGWLGPALQPDPFLKPDILLGTEYTRKMMLQIIKMGLPIGGEILFTHNFLCFDDLLSWGCIGARSGEDPEHRILASALSYPMGIKNPTHGSLDIGMNSVLVAQHSHIAAFDGNQIETHGNPYTHIVLRGSKEGQNYSVPYLEQVHNYIVKNTIKNPAILIDVSHENAIKNGKKNYALQPNTIFEIIREIEDIWYLKKLVKGFMVESFLKEGSQELNPETAKELDLGGLSVTDPCLGWDQTESLVLELAELHRLGIKRKIPFGISQSVS